MMSQSQGRGGRRRLTKQERATLDAPLPESYRQLSQPEVDALWRTGSEVERRRLGREGILPSWLLVRGAANRAGKASSARFTEYTYVEPSTGTAIYVDRTDSGLIEDLYTATDAHFLRPIGRKGVYGIDPEFDDGRVARFLRWKPSNNPMFVHVGHTGAAFDLLVRDHGFMSAGEDRDPNDPNRAGSSRQAGIINPYPGESAGQAVFRSKRKYDDEIKQAMARAFFVNWYAHDQERRQEDGLKARLAGPGEDWMDVAPNTSNAAKRHARAYAVKLSDANKGATLTDLYAAALNAGGRGPARDFGHYVAMQAMGHGVSWFDDNPEFEIEIPHGEFYQ